MKNILLCILVYAGAILPVSAQEKKVVEKLRDFFFAIPFESDIQVIRLQLSQDPDFKLYEDPNRDAQKVITGTLIKDKNLNPVTLGNQLIIQYSTGERKKRKNISIKWSMDYKHEDLPSVLYDYEKLKGEFMPLFTDVLEKQKNGHQGEQITTLTLKLETIIITISQIKFNNYIHTLSLEYRDRWKIEPVDILKVKY
jgi:hypothetical protein